MFRDSRIDLVLRKPGSEVTDINTFKKFIKCKWFNTYLKTTAQIACEALKNVNGIWISPETADTVLAWSLHRFWLLMPRIHDYTVGFFPITSIHSAVYTLQQPLMIETVAHSVTSMGVRECVFHAYGMQSFFSQIWSCFSLITYTQKILIIKLKRTIVNKSVSTCLITNRQISVTNQFMREWRSCNSSSRLQIKFNAATYCRASSLMLVSPSLWWIANWQISYPRVWNYFCLYTSSLPNHRNDLVKNAIP